MQELDRSPEGKAIRMLQDWRSFIVSLLMDAQTSIASSSSSQRIQCPFCGSRAYQTAHIRHGPQCLISRTDNAIADYTHRLAEENPPDPQNFELPFGVTSYSFDWANPETGAGWVMFRDNMDVDFTSVSFKSFTEAVELVKKVEAAGINTYASEDDLERHLLFKAYDTPDTSK